MWASNKSVVADAAAIAADSALHEVMAAGIHTCSPVASGRIAMAVYLAVFNAAQDVSAALYYTEWWATDGGDLLAVPDGTPPEL